ncbi:hypothetical protein X566_14260 [Afipia sp. P52-10]|uniref:hypothetical protein n=1 Tax=Afipia sp. P52-10 TaxID=1429916 RepID=UPI0003DF2D8C|nr:hypothetical protein [Afipia sp. P52-10]ETR79131.1 hypothetical protein X566_14260 [Afipia sp. P52-10]
MRARWEKFTSQRDVSEDLPAQIRPGLGAVDVRVLLRHESRREIAVEIEDGKTLVVMFTALANTREDGHVEVFFGLKSSRASSQFRTTGASVNARRNEKDSYDAYMAAPMPALVTSISVAVGQRIRVAGLMHQPDRTRPN